MRIAKPEQARSCSVQALPSALKSEWPAPGSIGHNTISRSMREFPPVRSRMSRPIAGNHVPKLKRKSATPWRMLALISMGIARFEFGATRGQLRLPSSKPRRSVVHDLRAAVRCRPGPGNAHTGSLVTAGFSRSIDGGSTGRRPPRLSGARTHGSGIPGRGAAERNERATPDLSHVSDADLQAIAAQGSSGATGRWSDAPLAHQWSNAPLAQAPGRNFDDVERAFSRPTPFRLPSDADQLSDEQFLGTPTPVGSDVAKSAASGISSGVQGLIGMGGDIRHAADYGMLWAEAKIAEKLGKLPPGQTDDVIAQYHGSAGRAFMSGLGLSDTAADVRGAGAPTTADVNRVANVAGVPSIAADNGREIRQHDRVVHSRRVRDVRRRADGRRRQRDKIGVIPGAASEAAGEATAGTGIEPWARFIAGAGAGVGSDLAATGRAAATGIENYIAPMGAEGQADLAATTLRNKVFSDPDAAQAELAKAAALQVPGEQYVDRAEKTSDNDLAAIYSGAHSLCSPPRTRASACPRWRPSRAAPRSVACEAPPCARCSATAPSSSHRETCPA